MNLPDGVTTRMILVRHGEPAESARGRCYGKLDVGLSKNGRRQIESAASFLVDCDLAAIYASPRRRAKESAYLAAAKCGLFVETAEDFAELDFGDFEGLLYEEVERRYPEIYRKWMLAPTEVEFPNGESFAAMQKRILQSAAELKQAHKGEAFAVVSHGGANRILLANALAMRDADIFRLDQSFAAINVVDFYDEFPVVRIINQTAASSWR